jgi:hypothetical protein
MEIIGIEGIDAGTLESEIARAGKFVLFQYCISAIFVTFKCHRTLKSGH